MTAIAKDQKWVLIGFGIAVLALLVLTNLPQTARWYDNVEDYQISEISIEEMAGWVIEGRNDFLPVLLQSYSGQKVDNIPGVLLIPTENLTEEIKQIPYYKKWVIITVDGTLENKYASVLTNDWRRRIILLKGGLQAWDQKITSKTPDWQSMDMKEIDALNNVRPFFQKTYLNADAEREQQNRYVAPPVAMPPLLQKKPEKYEGC
ncbi:MAG: hypothetical protein HQM11_12725 [SAR324 cluster bacterium]|nr:hypothetical protein [SAR324 cluster bacterium]